ncbi:hypothetical protein ACFE04_013016 [Oxalis oulophora]
MKKQVLSYTFFVIIFLIARLEARIPSGNNISENSKKAARGESNQGRTEAVLTVNSFEKGGGGGGPSECDGHYHSNNERVVALSTRWYAGGSRCFKYITIYGNGHSVNAKVVDECDSNAGCPNNDVDASSAVWKALGVSKTSPHYGYMDIHWADAK